MSANFKTCLFGGCRERDFLFHSDWNQYSLAPAGKQPMRRQWRMQRGCFEEVPRLAAVNSGRESAGTTVGTSFSLRITINTAWHLRGSYH